MKEKLALFPNITIEKACKLWGIKFIGKRTHVSEACEELSTLAVREYQDDGEEKAVIRQLEVLRCHLMLAAYIAGYDPFMSCRMIILSHEGDEPADAHGNTVPLSTLAAYLPEELEDSSRTVCWFVHYMEQPREDERGRVFRLYNALGTLPGGFDGISSLSSGKKDVNILTMLLKLVEDFHAQDKEEENYIHKTNPLSEEEIKDVEACYLKLLSKFYPQLG